MNKRKNMKIKKILYDIFINKVINIIEKHFTLQNKLIY